MDAHVTEQEGLAALEERASPFAALYDHWEKTQWASNAIDFTTDATSFAALPEEKQRGFVWIFAHRFHAEFNVATLLAPFLRAAPSYEMQLMIATQVADEHRHLQCVLRVYDEVFGVEGGLEAVRELADANMDPVASMLYEALDRQILELDARGDEDTYLKSVVGYHLLAEGVIARTAQNLAVGQYERLGDFPGLIEGQRLVARDEARHIGIGVSYARACMREDPVRTKVVVGEALEEFGQLAAQGLELGKAGLEDVLEDGYGVDAEAFHAEAMRLLQLRLRSIGYLDP